MRTRQQKSSPINGCAALFLFIIIVLLIIGFIGFNWYTAAANNPNSTNEEIITFKVEEGDNLSSIAPRLEKTGLIQSELALKIYLRLNNLSPSIKAGDYSIAKNLTLAELIDQLETGVFKKSIWVTLREALRPDQAAIIIDEEFNDVGDLKKFSPSEYVAINDNPAAYQFEADVQAFLDTYKPASAPLIGFLYPDTYNLNADSTALQVINKQIQTFISRLSENGIDPANYNPSGNFNSFYESLILASIIDKEAAGADDRQLISSVFHNRLESSWPLQSDATINFYTKRDDPRSTIEETQMDHPYNSYLYAGLVPTPINSPGVISIYASINPKESNYFFFRHDKDANIYFSETLSEHNQSIYLYP